MDQEGKAMKIRPWQLGNTTVRSPFRLRDGLVALSTSSLQGNLHGKEQEIAFRKLLGQNGIVELGDDDTYSVGRKWRSALNKVGFLYPEVPSSSGIVQNDIGIIDTITPNGWRLIRAETVPAMQECFLRSLAAYYIPSIFEAIYEVNLFSPLFHVLHIMTELEKITGDSHISFLEMATIVQMTSGNDEVGKVVGQIFDLRKRRSGATNKRAFDQSERENAAILYQYEPQTFNDYADLNLRYLKSTSLVQNKGRGIAIVPEKAVFIQTLLVKQKPPTSSKDYITVLCNGATLPTDDKDLALVVLSDLIDQLKAYGIPLDISQKPKDTPADIGIIRHAIEDLIFKRKEEIYAEMQISQWQEIAAYMELINTKKYKKSFENGEEIVLPKNEVPAYFEWILWRAFLAINSLINKPYEARRFKIDQDFLPIGTAPGNGPDLIFEFEKYDIVVEVTLTDNSRQEAAEGEPVRRHVAERVLSYGSHASKKVYGLFIANNIDSNTAETFRIGVWYTSQDEKLKLDIVPITLAQFIRFFINLFESKKVNINYLQGLLELCGENRQNSEAPIWKKDIESVVERQIEYIRTNK